MKKLIAVLLIICMLPIWVVSAEEEKTNEIFVFGDEWAKAWAEELTGYTFESANVVNCAENGALLSALEKNENFKRVGEEDVVILSYGVLERDRKGDNNQDFKKALESVCENLTKKKVQFFFVSICSTMRYNTMTNRMEETRNFYTETVKNFAKAKGITYIDLAALTADWANKLGANEATRLYSSLTTLTKTGNKLCADTVFEHLLTLPSLEGKLKNNQSMVYEVKQGEFSHTFDVGFMNSAEYKLYVKGGVNVKANSAFLSDGDSVNVVKAENGKVTVNFISCEKLQLTPVYRFDAAGFSTTETPYKNSVRPGEYDVTVQKTEALKASVYLNGYLIASNLDMPGTEPVPFASEQTFTNYTLEKKDFEVTVKGLTDKLGYISFSESPVIFDKKPKIFLAGDSTVCNYYPLARTGEELDGTVMTGWGMMLHKYVDADIENLAASGDWAANWLKNSFPIVEKEGKRGDIFIIQFGINDHDKSSVEEMRAALGEMIDRAAAKGIIPVLVSPQISAGYGWGEESNIGKSDGGAYSEFFDAVRELGEEKGCFYVDLTDLSSGWFSEIGRDEVYKKYHIWDYEKNTPRDMMHLSSKGADSMCRFFLLGLKKFSESNTTDKWGNTLSQLTIW